MKRQKNRCMKCYNYEPHFHPERLNQSLPRTQGDEFIWACSSGDIFFAQGQWIKKIIERIKEKPDRTFFFQSKNPFCFNWYEFPENVILGTTIETNRDYGLITKAPSTSQRFLRFLGTSHKRKCVTIEPIMDFDLEILVKWIKVLEVERVYVGYDTKKSNLPEPELSKTLELCQELSFFTKVKTKLLREANNE